MRRFPIIGLVLLLGGAVACADEPVSFKGKTITMMVASPPGGGTDSSGRLIAPLLGNLLPGKPTIVVRNIPGAEGVTAMNFFVKQVAPDGLTVTMGSTTQADPLLYRRPQSQYDPTTFAIIGGAGRGGTALIIRRDAEARLTDSRAAPAVMGALGGVPRSGMLATAWGIDILGWNAKWVLGYRGTKDLMLALARDGRAQEQTQPDDREAPHRSKTPWPLNSVGNCLSSYRLGCRSDKARPRRRRSGHLYYRRTELVLWL